jgi:hypothetical protein
VVNRASLVINGVPSERKDGWEKVNKLEADFFKFYNQQQLSAIMIILFFFFLFFFIISPPPPPPN